MNNPVRAAELKRRIAEHQAAQARLQEELLQIPYQETPQDGQLNTSKLSARSQSTAGYAMATPLMSQACSDGPAFKRQRRAMSQQTAQHMGRNPSNRSETGPFRHTGAALQPLPAPNRPAPNANQSQPHVSQPQDTLALPDVGVRPDEFLAGLSPEFSYLAPSNADLPLDMSNTLSSSKCPSMVSGWSAADGMTPMTRQNSFFGDQPPMAGVDMARWASESQSSRGFDEAMFSSQGHQIKQPYMDQDFLGVGANLSAEMARSYSSSIQSQPLLLSPPDSAIESTTMERSESSESTSSTRSTASAKRHKEALDRVLKASKVTLAPKPHPAGNDKPKTSSSIKKEGKVAVPKTSYQRRKPVKVFCTQCEEHPEGFRGDHELRRHVQSKHEGIVKKFICRDPAEAGLHTDLKVVKPLTECKQCRAGKQYGAYYNAAAHLRRQHFNPRVSRSKGKSEEKRGGKGGGDWPPMQELKAWFEERRVLAKQGEAADVDQEDNEPDAVDGEDDMGMESYGFDSSIVPYSLGQMGDGSMLSMDAPISSAATSFSLNQFADISPVPGMMAGFSGNEDPMYGSSYSAASTVTPSHLQDIGPIHLGDGPWGMPL